MVRLAVQARPSIAGGFVLVPVASLIRAWRTCRYAPLGVGDFRTWLACHELVTRRYKLDEGRTPTYSTAELTQLNGISEKRARASVRRLIAAGLLEWSGSAIGFPDPSPRDEYGVDDTIGGGRGRVAIPRRMLRLLVGAARPVLIATVVGVLLRCLSRRRDGFDGRGRVKAGWVARAFGVSVRQVKAARAELVAIGWIVPEPADQSSLNRWGRPYRIDLAWTPPCLSSDGSRSSPPPADPGSRSSPPDLHPELLRKRRNQEPTSGGPTGIEIRERGEGERSLPAPNLDDVRYEDLKDTGRTLELYRQAVARKLVGPSEADQLRVVAAAEHSLTIGKTNPPGLFRHLIAGRLWRYLTGDDEDKAVWRLKVHMRGPTSPVAVQSRREVVPDDVQVVREVRAALIRAGHYGDPFPAFTRLHPDWTRDRWDWAVEGASGRVMAPY